jgi:two-component system sensor histidine kinase KdpD
VPDPEPASAAPRAHPSAGDVALAVAGVVLATLAVEALKGVAPAVSLGVFYVLPVLLVATRSGVGLGVVTAVVSMAAYNWFELPPVRRFTLADERHWAALAVLLVVAVVSARIAEAGRRDAARADRARREADLLADLTTIVLSDRQVAAALPAAAARLGDHVGAPVTLRPWDPALTGDGGPEQGAVVLRGPAGPVGVLRWTTPGDPAADAALRERVAPALGAVLAAGLERERLGAEAVEAETLRRSDEVKTTLLRTVGHDLRTPLTQISAAAAALRSPSLLPDERTELATGIEEGSDRLAAMIGKLLDLSRLEVGAAEPRTDELLLDDLVRDALVALGPAAARVRVETEEPPPSVRADPVQVERIVVNLLENALLHGRPAAPRSPESDRVLVRIARRRGRAVVRVVDGGPGIPPEAREALFRPFTRGERSAGPGSGLGLAIARGFAEANGGSLRVESYPGQGTAFVLELPPAEGDADGAPPALPAPAAPAGGDS